MGTATATATALDDDDDDDDEDLSSLGDASPIQDLEVHEQQRHTQKQRARLRSGTISFVCIYFLVYMSLSSAPPLLMTDDSNYGLNRTVVFQTRIHHTQQVASTMARVYKPIPPSVWCIDGRLKMEQSKRRPMGLSYLKIPRAASTTAGGINRRIARNFAKRQGLESCIRHDGHVPGMYYYKRDELSYLWTLVRDPAQRAMSRVAKTFSKDPLMTTDTSINANYSISVLQQLKTSKDVQFGAISMGRGGFQLQYTMLSIIDEWSAWNASDPTQVVNPRQVQRHVEQVINGYDFIGVVERFDESIVALQLLLGLEPSDILYFSSRDPHQNPYERQPVKRKQNTFRCQLVWDWQSILMTPPIQHHLQSAEWFAKNYGDYLLYHASNQSLDRTIMKIGLDTFAKALKDFRQLLQLAQEQCQPIFPCSSSGFDQYEASQKNCYADDVGCGYPCLDDLKYDNLLDE